MHNLYMIARDRGCTRPGCDLPGYQCEVHHINPWAATHCTDTDTLTLACTPDHKLLEKGWITRKRANGYHHPEKLLCEDEDEP